MPHTKTVTISELRKDLARLVASVRYGSDFVVIRRKAEDNVYLISQADWDLLDCKIDELETSRWCDRRKRMVGGLMSFLRREKSLNANIPDQIWTQPSRGLKRTSGNWRFRKKRMRRRSVTGSMR